MDDPMNFSPFDSPVKDINKSNSPVGGGIKTERITDEQLDGKNPGADIPKDAPEFKIPNFDQVPNAQIPPMGPDPFAPGSANDVNDKKNSGSNADPNNPNGTKVDGNFAKEFSEYTAKWLVDIYFRLLIGGLCQYAKIDRSEILKAIDDGMIDKRFLKFVDEANAKVDDTIKITDNEKKFIIEPLKYFLEIKKISLKPEWMFITSLLMVSGTIVIQTIDVKKQNKVLLDKMIKESAEIRRAESSRRPPNYDHANTPANEETMSFSETRNTNGTTFTVVSDPPRPSADEEVIQTSVEEVPHEN